MNDCAEVPNFGMPVPRGGSSCSKCRSFEHRDGRPFCRHPDFIRFLGVKPSETDAVHIPAPDDDPTRYCCNAFAPAEGTMTAKSAAAVTLDLGVDDVHVPSVPQKPARKVTMSKLTTKQRKAIPKGQFAGPDGSYPIHDAAHVRNAAARLEQQKDSMPASEYRSIRHKIAAAARRFGIDSEYNKPKSARMRGGRLRMSVTHPDGTRYDVRHMAYESNGVTYLPPLALDPDRL